MKFRFHHALDESGLKAKHGSLDSADEDQGSKKTEQNKSKQTKNNKTTTTTNNKLTFFSASPVLNSIPIVKPHNVICFVFSQSFFSSHSFHKILL